MVKNSSARYYKKKTKKGEKWLAKGILQNLSEKEKENNRSIVVANDIKTCNKL